VTTTSTQADPRRHDLDALRAFAMLLGIVLHGAMSFIPGAGVFWGVQDSQSSPVYGVLLSSIHGWRMPLFFVVSGFFTAMLWQKRGLRALLIHRFKRIFLPLLLSMVTVIPTMLVVSGYLRAQGSATSPAAISETDRSETQVKSSQVESSDINVWAAVATDDQAKLKLYLDQGGDVLAKDPYGSTPLHIACLFGRAEAAELLLDADADLDMLNDDGKRPEDLLQLDWGTTAFIAQMVQLPVDQEEVRAGREKIARTIGEQTGRSVTATPEAGNNTAGGTILYALLFQIPVFFHLWFLWFLCWYVVGFAVIVKIVRALQAPSIPNNWLTSGLRYLWLIPLAAVPQCFMASEQYAYGPDTSTGLLPLPAVFAYYAIFFGFGALYFGASDEEVAVGHGFWWKLALAILILFPVGLGLQGSDSIGGRILFAVMQASYTWVMSFGMIGLFHRFCRTHRFWVRYLSDSSYWLYLVHIPLLMVFQFLVRDWPLPSFVKFSLVCTATTALLLLSYQLCVRNTWVGLLLNGRRYPGLNTLPHGKTVVAEDVTNALQESNA
jgi:peptidoglycan/LPS O-acetylase OafA/YrhL